MRPPAKSELQPFENNHVGRDEQERLGVIIAIASAPTALKNCQAIASDITLVLPLPVAILTQYRAKSSYGGKPTSRRSVAYRCSKPFRVRTFSNSHTKISVSIASCCERW